MTDQNNATDTQNDKPFAKEIVECDINSELKNAFMTYAMSVIVSRALPDFRDGLKPVHRRIIYSMDINGRQHNKAYSKCARIVGDVMGSFHPHGDGSIYDALVRMAQPFSLRYMLIDGQGNFGSVDGDSPAAHRYTEAKLKKLSAEIVADISKGTVDFKDNYDGKEKEPIVLPSKVPNLLLNGSTGIAVGMATNIPPHNLGEVSNALIALIDNPEIDVEELINHVKGPDFPTGGIICGRKGIRNYFLTGKGRLVIRSKCRIEENKGKEKIIVEEIPYMVNKANMLMGMVDLIKDKRVNGISDIRDESSRLGIRIVIEIKRDAQANVVLNQLYTHSRLQTSFGVNMLGLDNAVPKIFNLPQTLKHFVSFRFDVITRRTKYELKECLDKLHLIRGLKVAIDNIDEVIELIKSSQNFSDASQKLMAKYSLDEIQTKAILEMRISKLTGLEVSKLDADLKSLAELSDKLKFILDNNSEIYKIMKEEVEHIRDKYTDDRRTEISDEEIDGIVDEDLIKKEDVVVTVSKAGYVKRIPLSTYKIQKRGGRGVVGATTRDEDIIDQMYVANTHNYLLLFTSRGKIHWIKVYQIPEGSRQGKGRAIVNLIKLEQDEKVTSSIMVDEFDPKKYLIFATKCGLLKKTSLVQYSRPRNGGITAINLEQFDSVVKVLMTDGDQTIVVASKKGQAVRCKEKDVRSVGRNSKGVRGIRLGKDDEVVDFIKVLDDQDIMTITENGYGKRTKSTDYRLIGRGGKGVINIVTSERNGTVCAVRPINGDENVLLASENGIIIGVSANGISTIGRNTQGVRIMKLGAGDKVSSVTIFDEQEEEQAMEDADEHNKQNESDNMMDKDDLKEIGVEIDKVDESSADINVSDNELELTEDGHVVRDESYETHHASQKESVDADDADDTINEESEKNDDDEFVSEDDQESFNEEAADRESDEGLRN